MQFTDGDLKRLKDRLNKPIESATDDNPPIDLSENDTRALLARLEAAEACIEEMNKRGPASENWKEIGELEEAWRTKAGK